MDLEAAGERPHAGQPLAMGQAAVEDLELELGDELIADGDAATAIEDDLQPHPGRPLLRLTGCADYATVRALHVAARPWLTRVVFYTFAVLVGVPLAFSQVLLRGAPQAPSPPPPGYLAGSVVSEGLRLRTWTRRGSDTRPAVVIVHGLGDSPRATSTARTFARRGHTVLLLDLRAHRMAKAVRLGGHEREDVRAAMDALEGRPRGRGAGPHGPFDGRGRGAAGGGQPPAFAPSSSSAVRATPTSSPRAAALRPRWVPIIVTIAIAEWRAGFARTTWTP